MSKLIQGPKITLADTSSLFRTSMHCQSAMAIRQSDPNTLRSLDDQSTLDSLVNRLDTQLRVQWLQHRQNIKTPTFQQFADWKKIWANISRMDKDISPHQTPCHGTHKCHENNPNLNLPPRGLGYKCPPKVSPSSQGDTQILGPIRTHQKFCIHCPSGQGGYKYCLRHIHSGE